MDIEEYKDEMIDELYETLDCDIMVQILGMLDDIRDTFYIYLEDIENDDLKRLFEDYTCQTIEEFAEEFK